jgi:hypothetical protein
VPGQEYNGYTEAEARERAKEKLLNNPNAASADNDFDKWYSIHPKETGKWEVYRDDHGQDETLEIIDADRRGEAVDKAYDKYSGVIPFKVRAWYGDEQATTEPELSPRAKLAKRIVQPKQQPTQQATNERGVPYWEIYQTDNKHVVHTFLSDTEADAKTDAKNWLTSIGAEYPNRFSVRPKVATTTPAVKDADMDVAQNFDQPADATQRVGSWSIYDVTLGRELARMDNVPWSQADARANEFERGTGHNISVRGLSENFADGKGPGRPGDSQRHGIPKGATISQLEKASHAKGRKGQLARWQLNMRRGKAKAK